MPRINYKNRQIIDSSGKELDDNAKEAAYLLNKEKIEGLIKEDDEKNKINAYLILNKSYKDTNLTSDKPVLEWTSNEIIEKMKATRREASLGRIGAFESSDRVRKFRTRISLSETISNALQNVNDAKLDSLEDAGILLSASEKKGVKEKDGVLNSVAINWIPYLTRLKKENPPVFNQYSRTLEPSNVFKTMIEKHGTPPVMLDMLQIIEDTDMEEFAYTDEKSFIKDFETKYEKLKAIAEGSVILDYIKATGDGRFISKRNLADVDNTDSSKVTEAKCRLASEMLKDYEIRMRLMASPYYALFAGKDFEKLTEKKINKMKKPGAEHRALNAYLDNVIEFKKQKAVSYKGVNVTARLNTYFTEVKPAPAPDVRLESDKILENIDNLIRKMAADTKRASSYKKAKQVFRRYLEAQDPEEKANLLDQAVNAASTYLQNRSQSSYQYRKERCEELIALNVHYKAELDKEHEPEEQRNAERENELAAKAEERHQKAGKFMEDQAKKDKEAEDRLFLNERIRIEEERKAQEEKNRIERERLENERKEQERLENERKEQERLENERKNEDAKARALREQREAEERKRLEEERIKAEEERRRLEEERIKAEEERRRLEEEERKRAEEERRRREEELENKAAAMHESAAMWVPDLEDRMAKEQAELIKIEVRNRNLRIKKEHMNLAISQFNDLGTIGKSYKDSENARKTVIAFLDKYVFDKDKSLNEEYDKEIIDVIPTAMLVGAIKNHLNDAEKDNFAELIKADISGRIWENAKEYDELRKPIENTFKKKSGEITELDRLNVYEYALHNIYFGTAISDMEHDSLRNMDLKRIGEIGIHIVNYDEASPDTDKNETLESIPYAQKEKFIEEAAILLSLISGEDASIYKFLPIEELEKYTENAYEQFLNKKEMEKVLSDCLKAATAIKEKAELLNDAMKSLDKAKLIESIAKASGEDQGDLTDIPTTYLMDLTKRMLDSVQHENEMKTIYTDFKKSLLGMDEDFYRETFLNLDQFRREENETEKDILTRKEHAFTYLKKALGMDKVPDELKTLDDEKLYTLISNIGAIKYINESIALLDSAKSGKVNVREALKSMTDKEFETIGMNLADYDRAVKSIKSLELSKELSAGIENILKPEVEPEITKIPEDFKGEDIGIEYATEMAETFTTDATMTYKENKENIEKHRKKVDEKKAEEAVAEEKWAESTGKLLNIIGEIYAASAKNPIDLDQISRAIVKNASAFSEYMNFRNNKSKHDPFGDLLAGLSAQEKILIEGAKPVLDDLADACMNTLVQVYGKKPDAFLRWSNISKAFKENVISIDKDKAAKTLNDAVSKGEAGLIKLMNEATDDAFDQIGGMGIVDIFNFDGKKGTDKDNLVYVQNSLRYNKDKGQGKFLQTMMNDYYNDSRPEDKRFMLSFIIKDFKKNDTSSPRQKGGNYFASSLKGAGPLMQKMMQGVPEYMVVPELRNAMNVVKSDLRPIDEKDVKEVVSGIIVNSKKKITSIEIGKPLGAASVAQTFSCVVEGPKIGKQQAVIKILRPDAKKRLERELPLIRKFAVFADMPDNEVEKYKINIKKDVLPPHNPRSTEAGFLAQLSEIEKEFDLKNEAENCKTGMSKYGNKDTKVKSVELINVPTGENYLLMTKAEGTTLDRHIKESRDISQNALKPFEVKTGKNQISLRLNANNIASVSKSFNDIRNKMMLTLKYGEFIGKVAQLWTGEALYGSAWNPFNNYNFRHGDLHSGNIMVSEKYATILDYGNASSLHHDKVTEILKMMSSVANNNAEYFVDAFDELLKMAKNDEKKSKHPIGYEQLTPKQRSAYIKELTKIFAMGSPEDSGIKIMLSLTTAQSLGIKLPAELQNFSQCQQRLENSMDEIKQAVIEARASLDKIERMQLDDSLKESFDPYAVFQREMLVKDRKGNYKYKDSEEAAKMLSKEFEKRDHIHFIDELSPLMIQFSEGKDVSKATEDYINKYYDNYKEYLETTIGKESLTLDSFPGKIDEWRKLYKTAKEEYKKTGGFTKDTHYKLSMLGSFITMSSTMGNILTSYENKETIAGLKKKALDPPFDDLAFEKLMAICEYDLASIPQNVKNMEKNIKMPDMSKEETKIFNQESSDTFDAIQASIFKRGKYVQDFVGRLRSTYKSDTFEKEMKRVFNKYSHFKKNYFDYKKARLDFDNLTLDNSKEEFVKARKEIARLENTIVKSYVEICEAEFKEIAESTKDTYQLETMLESDNVMDYTDVIYKVMMDNKISTFKRLGKKYTFGIKESDLVDDDEAEKDQSKKEDKKEEKKVDKKAEAKKKKEEEKKKKEEEKKKKEEEKKKKKTVKGKGK